MIAEPTDRLRRVDNAMGTARHLPTSSDERRPQTRRSSRLERVYTIETTGNFH